MTFANDIFIDVLPFPLNLTLFQLRALYVGNTAKCANAIITVISVKCPLVDLAEAILSTAAMAAACRFCRSTVGDVDAAASLLGACSPTPPPAAAVA